MREGRIPSRRAGTDAAVLAAVLELSPRHVLDAGCGEGWLSRQIAQENIEVVAFDGSAPLIERARAAGGARFVQLSYDDFVDDAQRVGGDFDVVVFNFSLFTADIVPILRTARSVLRRAGSLVIQTVHPLNDAEGHSYQDAWRIEDFAAMGSDFASAMPWYFRTMSSWINSVINAGCAVEELHEPHNEATGRPLSLIIIARHVQ